MVDLRQHLLTLEKKEEYLSKKIDEEVGKAKNALAQGGTDGQSTARSAIRQKRLNQEELEKLRGMKITIETQVAVTPCIAAQNAEHDEAEL